MAPAFHVDVDWLAKEAISLSAASSASPCRPLVVGGSGLLGTNLVVLLSRVPCCEVVRVLDLHPPSSDVMQAAPNVEFVRHRLGGTGVDTEAEIKEEEAALLSALEGVDCVFSVVTPHVQRASEADFYATNEKGVQRLVNACLKKGVRRLVHLSSIAVTSHFIESVEQSEMEPLPSADEYESPYDITKRRGEDAVLQANNCGNLRTCSLRAGGIMLAPQDFIFANFQVLPGLVIQPLGKKIDFIDGRDVCTAMLQAAQALEERPEDVAGEAFFVTKSLGEAWAPGDLGKYGAKSVGMPFIHLPDWIIHIVYVLLWLIYNVMKLLGLSVPGVPPQRFLMMVFCQMTFDNSKAHKVLGWSPKVKNTDSVDRILALRPQQGLRRRPRNMLLTNLVILSSLAAYMYVEPSAFNRMIA